MSGTNPINPGVVDPLVSAALAGIEAASDLASLLEARSSLIGEASEVSKLNASIKNMLCLVLPEENSTLPLPLVSRFWLPRQKPSSWLLRLLM
jgi:hypothetical protein